MSPSKQGQTGGPAAPGWTARYAARRRLGVLVFGVLFIALFAIVAIAEGIGTPDVPDGSVAVVEDAPDGDVTQEELDFWIEVSAFEQGIREVPEPDSSQYEPLLQQGMSQALTAHWLLAEAEERGIEVSEREVDQGREDLIQQQIGSQKAYERFLEESPYDEETVLLRIELGLIGDRVSEAVREAPEITDEEVETYYEENAEQFERPETRDVREILTETEDEANEALDALGADPDAKTWEQVAKQYSTDEATKASGGLRPAVVEGQSEPALDEEIFSAPEGELVGPFETDAGFYVIRVESVTPAETQSLEDSAETIRRVLADARERQLATDFQQEFTSKWRSRTYCAEDYRVDQCANAPAPPSICTEKVAEARGCGAPVPSTRPAAPQLILPDPNDPVGQPPTPAWEVESVNLSGGAVVYKPQGPTGPQTAGAAGLPPGLVPTAPGAAPTAPPGG